MAETSSLSDSVWAATACPAPDAPPLEGERSADVVVVGGGYTGLSTALNLAERGTEVVVLEAAEVGWGGSGRNAGFVNVGLWLEPDKVQALVGGDRGERLVELLSTTADLVFSRIERHDIDCDPVRNGTIHAAHSRAGLRMLERRAEQMAQWGAPVRILDRETTAEMLGTDAYHGALLDPRAGTIQPLSYARGLARAAKDHGAAVHCASRVTALKREGGRWRAETPAGAVTADAVVLATNAYTDELWPGLKHCFFPVYCFAVATEPLGENVRQTILPGGQGVFDTRPALSYFRLDRDGRLILGSLGDLPRAERSVLSRWPFRMLRRLFPQVEERPWSFQWSGTFAFTTDHLPRLYEPEAGVLSCLGYNGRGIGPGTLMGKVLAERALGLMPEAELPLPVTPIRPVSARGLRSAFYETAFRTYHLGELVI